MDHAGPTAIEPARSGWQKHRKLVLGVALGAAFGLAYHYVVGCSTGTCPITARWWTSSLYGALMGFLMTRA